MHLYINIYVTYDIQSVSISLYRYRQKCIKYIKVYRSIENIGIQNESSLVVCVLLYPPTTNVKQYNHVFTNEKRKNFIVLVKILQTYTSLSQHQRALSARVSSVGHRSTSIGVQNVTSIGPTGARSLLGTQQQVATLPALPKQMNE